MSLLERVKRAEQAVRINEPAVVEEDKDTSAEFLELLESDFAAGDGDAELRQAVADVRALMAAGGNIEAGYGDAAEAWHRVLMLVHCELMNLGPISEAEIVELSAWYKINKERLRRYAKPHQFCKGGSKIEAYIIEGCEPVVTFQVSNMLNDSIDRRHAALILRELKKIDDSHSQPGQKAAAGLVELAKPFHEAPPTGPLDIQQEEPDRPVGTLCNGGVEHQTSFQPIVDIRSNGRTARCERSTKAKLVSGESAALGGESERSDG